ncbi:hypothetical protein BH18THE1_BH18THE1_17120 [soil metagenome]
MESAIFGENFGVISDITVGPDGYLYVVSLTKGEIYRTIPAKDGLFSLPIIKII